MGMVFQNYAIFPHMSVFDNVAFGLKQRKVPAAEIEKSVVEILDVVKIGHLKDRMPTQLSGGQQQRGRYLTWMQNCGWKCGMQSKTFSSRSALPQCM